MTNHKIEISNDGKNATCATLPNTYLYFGHNDFEIVWNSKTQTQDVVKGVDTFYGGMGEGSEHKVWQNAIHATLYDAFQVSNEIKQGDTFTVTFRGEVATFATESFHVVRTDISEVPPAPIPAVHTGGPVNIGNSYDIQATVGNAENIATKLMEEDYYEAEDAAELAQARMEQEQEQGDGLSDSEYFDQAYGLYNE